MTRELSELEREFELELEETGDASNDSELGFESDLDGELEEDEEIGDEEIADLEANGFAARLGELSLAQEAGEDIDERVREVVEDMEREYFFKGLVKRLSKAGKGLVKRGLKMAKGLPAFQAISGLTQLARGNLKGMLANLAKTGLQAAAGAIPGGAIALPALQSMGIVPGEASDPDWARFTEVAERAYDHLARNLNEQTPNPAVAAQQASAALSAGLSRGIGAHRWGSVNRGGAGGMAPGAGARRTVRVTLGPGERLVVTRR